MLTGPDYQFLEREPLIRAAARFCAARGSAECLARDTDGLILYDRCCETHMLCASSDDGGRRLVSGLSDCRIFLSERLPLADEISARYRFTKHMATINVVYADRRPIPTDNRLEVRPVDDADLASVLEHYPHHGFTIPELRQKSRSGTLVGGYLDNRMAGFIGCHDEGSVGMLFILPEYRRRGFAYTLEAQYINRLLPNLPFVYAQIETGNTASLELHRKLGFSFAAEPVIWLYGQTPA